MSKMMIIALVMFMGLSESTFADTNTCECKYKEVFLDGSGSVHTKKFKATFKNWNEDNCDSKCAKFCKDHNKSSKSYSDYDYKRSWITD